MTDVLALLVMLAVEVVLTPLPSPDAAVPVMLPSFAMIP